MGPASRPNTWGGSSIPSSPPRRRGRAPVSVLASRSASWRLTAGGCVAQIYRQHTRPPPGALPVGEHADVAAPVLPDAAPAAVAGANVLVVEDEAPLRGLVTEVMHGLGHHVGEATTGHEALVRLRERTWDLVMLDLRLPDVD